MNRTEYHKPPYISPNKELPWEKFCKCCIFQKPNTTVQMITGNILRINNIYSFVLKCLQFKRFKALSFVKNNELDMAP